LKSKAFETILVHLLSNSTSESLLPIPVKKIEAKIISDQSESFTGPPNLEMSSSDLAELRGEIQKKEKINAWEGALIIAGYFEKTGHSMFSSAELEKVYRSLIRGGANKLPIVRDYKSLTKDLVRYKLWFDRVRRGQYKISDAGVRALQELNNSIL